MADTGKTQDVKLKQAIPTLRGSIGLFISPQGELLEVQQSHISAVVLNPSRFGLTSQEIESAYSQYNEPVGVEGRAREQILRVIIVRGWIRLRRYFRPRERWSVTVCELNDRTRTLLREWAGAMLAGTLGYREDDPHKLVEIIVLSSREVQSHTVEALARGCFLGSN